MNYSTSFILVENCADASRPKIVEFSNAIMFSEDIVLNFYLESYLTPMASQHVDPQI